MNFTQPVSFSEEAAQLPLDCGKALELEAVYESAS
jgi:hypothetical protein